MPTIAQIEEASRIVEEAEVRLKAFSRSTMWCRTIMRCVRRNAWAAGAGNSSTSRPPARSCYHAAETITGLEFLSVRSKHSIAWLWQNSEAFNRYRGTGWMKEPCKSCEFREIDFGGCRCQAFALTGDAGNTDPACTLSPMHEDIFKQAEIEAAANNNRFLYRNFAGGTLETEGEHGA